MRIGSRGRRRGHCFASAACFLLAACGTTPVDRTAADAAPTTSSARTPEDAGLVDIRTRVPDIDQDIRYAGSDNFVGAPVDGYAAPRCFLLRPAADALQIVEQHLRDEHLRLRLWDCYRPVSAVQHFVRWAHDLQDQRTKAAHYPNLDKTALLGDYIAPVSGHSRGATLDLTLLQCNDAGLDCRPLDMGTDFDLFDARANTESPAITPQQRANRERLRTAMTQGGFRNYPLEWWHYTLDAEPTPHTQYDVPVQWSDPMTEVGRFMQRYAGEVPGASLLVVRDGVPLVRKGYGLADLETQEAATPATHYRLASVTKQFTAASILLLAQDGKLTLDDPVRRWLPTLPHAYDAITLRHLLTHTSGIVDYEDLTPDTQTEQLTDEDVLRLVSDTPSLYFAPGAQWRYSNSGFVLLGLVVERASGLGFAQFLQQRIFQPLGMDSLLYEHGRGPEVPHRAYGYSEIDGRWQRTDQSVTSATRGDGGIYASIDDLAKWDAALYDDRLLSAESRKLAFGPAVHSDDPTVDYGYGWRISGDTLWHSGESIGFRNVIVRYPRQHLTVILLSNRNDPEPAATARSIAERFLPH